MAGLPTKVFTHRLSEHDLESLQAMIGQTVLEIHAPSIVVSNLWLSAPSVSIRRNGRYLVIASEWRETPVQGLNWFILSAELQKSPKDISFTITSQGHIQLKAPVSSISIGPPKSPVDSILVLERSCSYSKEGVLYDSGLVFALADGRRFAVAAMDSISGDLECTTHEVAIQSLINESRVRLTIEGQTIAASS